MRIGIFLGQRDHGHVVFIPIQGGDINNHHKSIRMEENREGMEDLKEIVSVLM